MAVLRSEVCERTTRAVVLNVEAARPGARTPDRALIETLLRTGARPTEADRIDPCSDPTPRGPWPPVTDLTRIYDHGRDWCTHRDARPEQNGGYPAAPHLPSECRTREYFLDVVTDARTRLDGERDDEQVSTAVGLSFYCASAFRFGQARASALPSVPRVVLETWTGRAEGADRSNGAAMPGRVALTVGEALKLARLIEHVVETVMFDA